MISAFGGRGSQVEQLRRGVLLLQPVHLVRVATKLSRLLHQQHRQNRIGRIRKQRRMFKLIFFKDNTLFSL